MKKNGFTLIEMIAVIIILGVILLIAVPAVSSYILNSNEGVYANDISTFIQETKLEYNDKTLGPRIEENEIMLVPVSMLTLQKGSNTESPFGKLIDRQSYIIIKRTGKSLEYYATVVDAESHGVVEVKEDEINRNKVGVVDKNTIESLDYFCTCNGAEVKKIDFVYQMGTELYKPVECRIKTGIACSEQTPIVILEKQ